MLGRFSARQRSSAASQYAVPGYFGKYAVPSCRSPARRTVRSAHRPTLPGMQPETRHAPIG